MTKRQLFYYQADSYRQKTKKQRTTANNHKFHHIRKGMTITCLDMTLFQINTYAVRQSE